MICFLFRYNSFIILYDIFSSLYASSRKNKSVIITQITAIFTQNAKICKKFLFLPSAQLQS